jgi:hypothetical protein
VSVSKPNPDYQPAVHVLCGWSVESGWEDFSTHPYYRILKSGETLQEGDEFWSEIDRAWKKTKVPGEKAGNGILCGSTYRRPSPGNGYRFLNIGDRIESSDEYFFECDGAWVPSRMVGLPVDCPEQGRRYRRKLPPNHAWPLL